MITAEREITDLKTAELGYGFDAQDLRNQSKLIYGGVSWPGICPGFAVVVAMSIYKHFDSYDIYLLDEYESEDMRKLVRQCGVLDFKYQPDCWIGDNRNDAADHFIREMNRENEPDEDEGRRPNKRRRFSLRSTPILSMECSFQYILPEIKKLLDEKRRQLFLKGSKVLDYLGTIRPEEILSIEFGDFPAIEALAFAVIEIRRSVNKPSITKALIREWTEKHKKAY